MDERLQNHVPDERARARARSAGVDLDELKLRDPETYMLFCAAPLLTVTAELAALAEPLLHALLPEHRLFSLPQGGGAVRLLVFPVPRRDALERLDERMGELAALPDVAARHAYYRVVRDRRGVHRELALPLAPERWRGEATMVGPFPDEAAAEAWGERSVPGRGRLTYDALPYAGAWFCDVFEIDEE